MVAFDNKSPILINGSVRSGTTWLMEALSANKDYYALFEPDNYLQELMHMKFRYRYFSTKYTYPEFDNIIKKIYSNDIYSLESTRKHSRDPLFSFYLKVKYNLDAKKIKNKSPVLKLTRGHMALPYLDQNFKQQIFIILRHPAASIYSAFQKKYIVSHFEEIFDERNHELFSNNKAIKEKLDQAMSKISFRKLWDGSISEFDRKTIFYTINWAFVNSFVLDELKKNTFSNQVKVLFYEDLLMNPEEMLKKVFRFVGFDSETSGFNDLIITKSGSSKDSTIDFTDREKNLAKWNHKFSPFALNFIQEVLEIFKMDVYDIDHNSVNKDSHDYHLIKSYVIKDVK